METNSKQSKHMREALVCYQTSRGSNLINIIKCIDTNPINLTNQRLAKGLRKIDTNPINLTNQRLGQGFFESTSGPGVL